MNSAGSKAGLLAAVAVASGVSTVTFMKMNADGEGSTQQTSVLLQTPTKTKGNGSEEVTPTAGTESNSNGNGGGGTGGSKTTNQDPLSQGIPDTTSNKQNGDYYSNFKAETWGCSKKLFPGIEGQVDHNWTQYHYFNSISRKSAYGWKPATNTVYNSNGANDPRLAQTQQQQTIGCALVKLRPMGTYTGHNKDFYLQSEIVVKNDKVGLILWTNWATNNGQTFSAITYRMMLLFNEGSNGQDQWKLKGGLWWNDNNDLYYYTKHRDYYIKMPGENTHWYSTQDSNSTVSSEKTWSAIWKPKTDNGGKQIYEDILISSGGKTKSEFLGRPGAPFEKCTDTKRWCGWYYGGYFYETQQNNYTQRAKGWWGFARYTDISKTLQSWYKAFKNVKGEWTKSATVCNGISDNSSSTNSAPLQKLCQTSTSQTLSS